MSLFRAFFLSMVYVFTMQKISLNWAPLQDFLNIVLNFGKTCFQKNVVNIFWCKIWVITISKSAKFLVWWVLLNGKKCLLLSTFSTFQTPLTVLTNSALHHLIPIFRLVLFHRKNDRKFFALVLKAELYPSIHSPCCFTKLLKAGRSEMSMN